MEKKTTLDALEDPPASTALYVALPDAGDAAHGRSDALPVERPWWRPSLATRRGQSAPARLLTRLTSGGDGHGRRLRHAQTIEDATANGPRSDDGFHPARAFLRALSSLTDATPPPVEKFRCYICFEDVPVAEAVTLSSCRHRYCQSCFQSYLTNQISDGHVHPVCFHPLDGGQNATPDDDTANTRQLTCGVAIADDQIQSIVHADVWTKFNKFRFNQKHQHARECPHCSFTQECAGPSNPSCVCSQCERPFCFFHGNAHEYGTCSDYELKIAEAEALNRAVINKLAKPCPGCSRDIEKNGGCNHMTCVACQTSFCWLCGDEVEAVAYPSHFAPAGGGSCSGKQYDGAQPPPQDRNDPWNDEREYLGLLRSAMRFEVSENEWGIGVIIGSVLAFTLALLLALIFTALTMCSTRKHWVFGRVYNKVYRWLEAVCLRVFGLVDKVIFIVSVLALLFLFLVIDVVAFLLRWMCKPSTRDQTEASV